MSVAGPNLGAGTVADGAATARRLPSVRVRGGAEALVGSGVVLWCLLGIVLEVRQTVRVGGAFTGVLTPYPGDTFQYLSWVRDSGLHGLISDQFHLGASHADYLQPMFLVSGILWRLGLSLPVAYLLWLPVVAGLSVWTFARLIRRHLSGLPAAGALALALAYASPAAIWAWGHADPTLSRVLNLSWELSNATALWGYLPRALAVALMPALLLNLEAILDSERRLPGRRMDPHVAAATGCALGAAWLHPWQGATALGVILAIAVWSGRGRLRGLVGPAIGAAAPLLYYALLSRLDPDWAAGQAQSVLPHVSLTTDVLVFAPLVVVALLGARMSLARTTRRRLLLAWVAVATVGYLASPIDALHVLNGVTLPLGILAVDGWTSSRAARLRARLSLGRATSHAWTVIGVGCVALCTVPGLFLFSKLFRDSESTRVGMTFSAPDNQALRFLDGDSRAGGVLATTYIASAVPGFTGRPVWAGHFAWTPGYEAKAGAADLLFTHRLPPRTARRFIASTGARFILVDCLTNRTVLAATGVSSVQALAADLGPSTVRHTFGCATVLELTGSTPSSS